MSLDSVASSQELAEKLIKDVDIDGDGAISMLEFKEMMKPPSKRQQNDRSLSGTFARVIRRQSSISVGQLMKFGQKIDSNMMSLDDDDL